MCFFIQKEILIFIRHKIYKGCDSIIIHIVKEGDSLYKLGEIYNVDYKKIASDNDLPLNEDLVIGQTIVIITSETIKDFRQIEVNGFAFPNIDKDILEASLPYLTYLSIFSYYIDYNGNLKTLDDDDLILVSKKNNIIPIMVITNIGLEDKFDSNLARNILYKETAQNKLIANILTTMYKKGYGGLNIDFEYIYPDDKNAYLNFLNKVKISMKKYNYLLTVSVAPKNSDTQEGILYEALDYEKIGMLADRVILMTYEWGYSGGPAKAVSPIKQVQEVLDYATLKIPSNKILMGIPNYGYDWTLPYVKGESATSVGNYESVDIARKNRQAINYTYEDQAPYFYYFDSSMRKHEVWFEDARSIQAKLELVMKYNLAGISYWTINRLFPQNYLVLDSLYTIKKILIK